MNIRVMGAAVLLATLPLIASAADEAPAKVTSESREHGGPFVDIADLIERVRKKTGKQFLLDPRLRAEVPVGTLDLERLDYARLLDILRLNMFTTYEADGLVVVTVDANERQLPMPVSTSISSKTLDSELVTLLIQARNVCADETGAAIDASGCPPGCGGADQLADARGLRLERPADRGAVRTARQAGGGAQPDLRRRKAGRAEVR